MNTLLKLIVEKMNFSFNLDSVAPLPTHVLWRAAHDENINTVVSLYGVWEHLLEFNIADYFLKITWHYWVN